MQCNYIQYTIQLPIRIQQINLKFYERCICVIDAVYNITYILIILYENAPKLM